MSLYLGTSPIAGGMSAETLVDTLYPVGSCYIGVGAVCPLAAIKGTWTLQSSGIVTSVNTNVPIKGDGKVTGWQTKNGVAGMRLYTPSSVNIQLGIAGNASGTDYGTGETAWPDSQQFGLATDANQSHIVGTVTRSTLSVNIWERTA